MLNVQVHWNGEVKDNNNNNINNAFVVTALWPHLCCMLCYKKRLLFVTVESRKHS